MQTVRVACHAMATRFEVLLHGPDPIALRAAGEEALREIERLEAQLSLYRETSEVACINAQAARKPVRVTPSLFALFQRAQTLSAQTGGAFDITVAPLVRCWGFMHGTGHVPSPEALAEVRASVGMRHLLLDPEALTVRFSRPGVMIDLGGIGKGYAIDLAAEALRDCGITSALLHGGTSSLYAIGRPPGQEAWKVAIDGPPQGSSPQPGSSPAPAPARTFATVALRDQAMSVSAIWGKSFQAEGKTMGHLLDPRTGQPATSAVLAAVVLPSGTEAEAFSTALVILGSDGQERLSRLRPGMGNLLVRESGGEYQVQCRNLQS